jgi:antagonist of KipI
MDPFAHRVANALVGNHADAATLEVTLDGPEIEFEDERQVAVAGAEFMLTLDGTAATTGEPFHVVAGARLKFGGRRRGARAYLAVSGGIDVPPTLGSRATHVASRMGGFGGRALAPGDRLPLGSVPPLRTGLTRSPAGTVRDANVVRLPDGPVCLRVLAGPQVDRFRPDALDTLQSGPYRILSESDRMAFRLEGPPLHHARDADMISDATPLGAVQVLGSGQPVLLMADRQTSGGYPKIANVVTADIGIAGQLAPGDTLSFRVCTMRDALGALIAQERALMSIESCARW